MAAGTYTYHEGFECTEEMVRTFNENGYIVIKGLLGKDEVKRVNDCLIKDPNVEKYSWDRSDGKGLDIRLSVWNQPGNDVTGMVARSEKIVNTVEKLLGGEVYHYHTKLIMKNANTGGSFLWHQDYGYWYNNGCLYPDMATIFIAIDKADRSNGCLKFLRGSQKAGRIDHVPLGEQVAADPERVDYLAKCCPLDHGEAEPGDAIFFHSNLLHTSDQNRSPNRRWAFLVAYNRADNDPVIEHHHPKYTPLVKVPNSAIMECQQFTMDPEEKAFFKGGVKADSAFTKIKEKR